MRHRKAGRRLSRTTAHREAMLRNMVTSLFAHERIRTTDAKAKELRGVADKMVTLAKRGDMHARRQALAVFRDRKVVKKLFDEMRERFVNRDGGYTRIVKVGMRLGDAAPISLVEIVKSPEEEKAARKKTKK
ncbi:MAG: 50S ribosomal protein L17 [Pseudomonadota bacterium]